MLVGVPSSYRRGGEREGGSGEERTAREGEGSGGGLPLTVDFSQHHEKQLKTVKYHEYLVQLVDLRITREEGSLVGHLYGG
jgi:hypothetical protein